MKTKERLTDNRCRALPSAKRRQKPITAFRGSGKSQAAFCREHGANATTFNGWLRKGDRRPPRFAEVELRPQACAEPGAPVAVEVLLPNGARGSIRHEGERDELVAPLIVEAIRWDRRQAQFEPFAGAFAIPAGKLFA